MLVAGIGSQDPTADRRTCGRVIGGDEEVESTTYAMCALDEVLNARLNVYCDMGQALAKTAPQPLPHPPRNHSDGRLARQEGLCDPTRVHFSGFLVY